MGTTSKFELAHLLLASWVCFPQEAWGWTNTWENVYSYRSEPSMIQRKSFRNCTHNAACFPRVRETTCCRALLHLPHDEVSHEGWLTGRPYCVHRLMGVKHSKVGPISSLQFITPILQRTEERKHGGPHTEQCTICSRISENPANHTAVWSSATWLRGSLFHLFKTSSGVARNINQILALVCLPIAIKHNYCFFLIAPETLRKLAWGLGR